MNTNTGMMARMQGEDNLNYVRNGRHIRVLFSTYLQEVRPDGVLGQHRVFAPTPSDD